MAIPTVQREAARFLAEQAGAPPTETHVSAVFVGRDTVWKLKKAVALPYLDFRTLEARHHDLERELALNKPAAPGLYRDVVPLVRGASGGFAFGGRGEVVEWVLRMAPIEAADFFDRIAAEGRLTSGLARALGRAVARYHSGLAPLAGIAHLASLERLAAETLVSARAAGCDEADVRRWGEAIGPTLARRADWLEDRAVRGFVRRAHGDLHLRNVCLWHGEPVPFDALEFDERLARIDLGFDLAFLLMDCDLRVSRMIASEVLTSYVAASGDVALVGGLVPFLSLRAITRAHVERAGRDEARARRYLRAALDYLVPPPPAMLAVGGLPGTGKSTLAHALAPVLGPAPGAVVLSSDVVRKRRHGIPPETRLPEAAYTAEAGEGVAAELLEAASCALRFGHAVVLDATFLDPRLRAKAEAVAEAAHVPFLGLWLEAPLSVLEARLEARGRQAVPDPSDATIAVLHRFARGKAAPAAGWMHVSALTREGMTTVAQKLLERHLVGSVTSGPR